MDINSFGEYYHSYIYKHFTLTGKKVTVHANLYADTAAGLKLYRGFKIELHTYAHAQISQHSSP